MNTNGIVYIAINKINGKVYIGQTLNGLDNRKKAHINKAKNNKTPTYFHNAIRKYGAEAFIWKVLRTVDMDKRVDSQKELDELEIYYIKKFKSSDRKFGYNLKLGGLGGRFSAGLRQKLRSNPKLGEKVILVNIHTKKMEVFNSSSLLARYLNIPRPQITNAIKNFNVVRKSYIVLKWNESDKYDVNYFLKKLHRKKQASKRAQKISVSKRCFITNLELPLEFKRYESITSLIEHHDISRESLVNISKNGYCIVKNYAVVVNKRLINSPKFNKFLVDYITLYRTKNNNVINKIEGIEKLIRQHKPRPTQSTELGQFLNWCQRNRKDLIDRWSDMEPSWSLNTIGGTKKAAALAAKRYLIDLAASGHPKPTPSSVGTSLHSKFLSYTSGKCVDEEFVKSLISIAPTWITGTKKKR